MPKFGKNRLSDADRQKRISDPLSKPQKTCISKIKVPVFLMLIY